MLGFNSGQWPLSQNQQYQQQLGMQGPPQQFMQAWQNPLQNQQTLPPSSFGWHASPQHIQYHHTQVSINFQNSTSEDFAFSIYLCELYLIHQQEELTSFNVLSCLLPCSFII